MFATEQDLGGFVWRRGSVSWNGLYISLGVGITAFIGGNPQEVNSLCIKARIIYVSKCGRRITFATLRRAICVCPTFTPQVPAGHTRLIDVYAARVTLLIILTCGTVPSMSAQ
jgi:hypothetical protein